VSKTKIVLTLLAVTFAAPLGLADKASAAQKSYVWAGVENMPWRSSTKKTSTGQASWRTMGCMMRYGYQLSALTPQKV